MFFCEFALGKIETRFLRNPVFRKSKPNVQKSLFGIFDKYFWNIMSLALLIFICEKTRCFRGLRAQILGTVSAPKSTGKENRRKLRNEKVNQRIASSVFSVFAVFCFRCKAFWLPLSGKYQINDKHPAQVKSRLVWGVSLCFYGRNDNNIYWQKQMK